MKLLDGTPIDETQFKTWLAALRSGKYEQTEGCLEDAGGYCCLGVACQVLIEKPIKDSWGYIQGWHPVSQSEAPNWLVRIDDDLEFRTGTSVARRNDELNSTFAEIADVLEATYGVPK